MLPIAKTQLVRSTGPTTRSVASTAWQGSNAEEWQHAAAQAINSATQTVQRVAHQVAEAVGGKENVSQHHASDDAINTAAKLQDQPSAEEPASGVGPPGPMINDTEPDALPDDGPKDINNQNPY